MSASISKAVPRTWLNGGSPLRSVTPEHCDYSQYRRGESTPSGPNINPPTSSAQEHIRGDNPTRRPSILWRDPKSFQSLGDNKRHKYTM